MKESLIPRNSLPLQAHLYNDTHVKNLNLPEIVEYLRKKEIFSNIEIKGSFLKRYGKPIDETATKLAKTRLRNLETPKRDFEVSDSDIEFEKEIIGNNESEMTSVLYDGFRLGKNFTDLIPEKERKNTLLHIIYTNRFFATWKPATQRYHARISVYGLPSIISTTGIVDAPARPKEFYQISKQEDSNNTNKLKIINNKEKYAGDFVDYDDERLTEIMKGYAMQAVFYYLHSGPFCNDNHCRLYNPHLQRNILNAQLTTPEFCKKHQNILKKMQEIAQD